MSGIQDSAAVEAEDSVAWLRRTKAEGCECRTCKRRLAIAAELERLRAEIAEQRRLREMAESFLATCIDINEEKNKELSETRAERDAAVALLREAVEGTAEPAEWNPRARALVKKQES